MGFGYMNDKKAKKCFKECFFTRMFFYNDEYFKEKCIIIYQRICKNLSVLKKLKENTKKIFTDDDKKKLSKWEDGMSKLHSRIEVFLIASFCEFKIKNFNANSTYSAPFSHDKWTTHMGFLEYLYKSTSLHNSLKLVISAKVFEKFKEAMARASNTVISKRDANAVKRSTICNILKAL